MICARLTTAASHASLYPFAVDITPVPHCNTPSAAVLLARQSALDCTLPSLTHLFTPSQLTLCRSINVSCERTLSCFTRSNYSLYMREFNPPVLDQHTAPIFWKSYCCATLVSLKIFRTCKNFIILALPLPPWIFLREKFSKFDIVPFHWLLVPFRGFYKTLIQT